MKAQPCKLVSDKGYQSCSIEEATHLTIDIPGPSGRKTLPFQIRGRREGTGNWTWNGDTEKPTLRPSILTQGTVYNGGEPADKINWPAFRCHTWITDGTAQYLDDCSHELRGATIELNELS